MAGVNKVILIGRAGKDPEVRNLENNRTVASFSLATSETYKDRTTGERKEVTEWHNIQGWGNLATIMGKYVKKGDMISIIGKIRYRDYNDKQGVKRYVTEIVADELQLLSSKQGSGSKPQANAQVPDENNSEGETSFSNNNNPNDDLPF